MVVDASIEGAMFNLRGRGQGNGSARTYNTFEGLPQMSNSKARVLSKNLHANLRSRACPRCQRTYTLIYARGLARDVKELTL